MVEAAPSTPDKIDYINMEEQAEKDNVLQETKALLKGIDVGNNAEREIQNFFGKLDEYDAASKLQLLQDTLKDGNITIGN
jgi:hypothetical protein